MNSVTSFLPQKRRRRQRQFKLRKRRSRFVNARPVWIAIIAGIAVTLLLLIINFILNSDIKDDETSRNSRIHKLIKKVKNLKDTKQRLKDDCIEFPASVQNEEWEKIEHPVSAYKRWDDPENLLKATRQFISVPYLYGTRELRETLGNSGQTLMTRSEADTIGSHIYLNTNTLQLDTNQCSGSILNKFQKKKKIKLETINVLIASFRDGTMCKNTIEGIFWRAKYPQRIRVTVVDQILPVSSPYYDEAEDYPCTSPTIPCASDPSQVLCKYKNQIDALHFDALASSGPVFARHLGYRMYRGEYFVLACDSHVEFTKHWDTEIIEQWYATNNEMAIFSAYPDASNQIDVKTGERLGKCRAIMCSSKFENGSEGLHLRHDHEPCDVPSFEDNRPQLEPFWGAGFSFGRGHWVVQVPYDLYLPNIFQGEESNIQIRAFSYGYDFYAPAIPVVYHYYVYPKGVLTLKKGRPKLRFWDLPTFDDDVAIAAMQRLNSVIKLSVNDNEGDVFPTDLEEYGLGHVRSPERFYRAFGLHTNKQSREENLCMFVSSKSMNNLFLPALREDSMGIDYSHENLKNFAFKDEWPCPEYWWNSNCESSDSDSDSKD